MSAFRSTIYEGYASACLIQRRCDGSTCTATANDRSPLMPHLDPSFTVSHEHDVRISCISLPVTVVPYENVGGLGTASEGADYPGRKQCCLLVWRRYR